MKTTLRLRRGLAFAGFHSNIPSIRAGSLYVLTRRTGCLFFSHFFLFCGMIMQISRSCPGPWPAAAASMKKGFRIMQRDLTKGNVFLNLIHFSIPFLFSYFLQVLYGLADLYITGRFNATESITAVAIGSQIMHMITVMIVGLAMGATVSIGKAYGAKDKERTAKAVGNTITLFLSGSLILMLILLSAADRIVAVMSTPEEAVPGTRIYLMICFLGIPFITAYNVLSSVFRGLGDSRSPMYFIIVACICNILLDYLFIGYFRLGPAGAALGTTLAQAVSVIAAFAVLKSRRDSVDLHPGDFLLQKDNVSAILKVGIPVSVQDGFIQISFLVITVFANLRGLDDAAAVGIVEKVIGILFLVPSSLLSAVSALCALNLGAGEPVRAKQTLRYAVMLAVGFGFIASVITQFTAPAIVGIFETNPNVIRLGAQYLKGYVWDCIFAGVHFCFSGYFCAVEHAGLSFLHNALSVVLLRIPVAYITSRGFPDTLLPMGFSAPAGSLLSIVICLAAYRFLNRKDNKV